MPSQKTHRMDTDEDTCLAAMKVHRDSVVVPPALSYTKQDLCFGKYFKAVNRLGTLVLMNCFKLIYRTLETDDGTLSIENYCLDKINWSHTAYNKCFNTTERKTLSKSPTSDDFVCDVSLLFKIIMIVLGTQVEPIRKEIRELKNLRNAVCHENLEMDDQELQRRLLSLKDVCRDILEGTQLLVHGQLRASLNKTITDVEAYMQNLLMVKLDASDINSYLEDLDEFRQKKTSKMISEGRKELMSNYSKDKILNPCPWLTDSHFSDFTVENTFTTIKLQESGTVVTMNDILNLSQLKQRFVPRLVIISGVMGAGKTSLYRYLLQQWCSHAPAVTGLAAVDIVIGLEMRWLTCGSLVQFLREQLLKDTSRLFSESDIIPVLQEINVLFIIDGMDEATRRGRAVVKEIITKFTNSTILVTTRPEYTLELKKMADEHVVLHIEGFTSESQEKFVEKVFAVKYPDKRLCKKETVAFLAYKNSLCVSLSSHLSLPLNLALLMMLWCDDYLKATSVTTTTRLYNKIYEMSQQKLTQRLESKGFGHSASLNLKVRRCLLELGRVAWNMMLEETLCLSQKHSNSLMEFCEKEGIDPIQTLSTFLDSETTETLMGTVCSFSFHHCSSEEYLAALYISEEAAKTGTLFPLLQDVKSPRFQEVVMYTTGLLKLKNLITPSLAKEIEKVLRSIETQLSDPLVLYRLVNEVEWDAAVCEIVGSIVKEQGTWLISSKDPLELTEAKFSLINNTYTAPSQMKIDIQYPKKLEDCPELENLIKLLGKMSTKSVKISIERHFHTVGEQELVDKLLVPFLRNDSLLEFMGHVGPDFTAEMVQAINLEALSVRITSMEALVNLSRSLRKHRHRKTLIMPSRKWSLQHLEVFLDISDKSINPSDIPRLHYRKGLVLKMAGVRDEDAKWAGQVVQRINDQYASVTLVSSHITPTGIGRFVKATSKLRIKVMRVMSDKLDPNEQISKFPVKRGTKVQLGAL